ncbi:MAG: hypothetical protein AB7V50_02560 [Vampirovibrionia bacterium]
MNPVSPRIVTPTLQASKQSVSFQGALNANTTEQVIDTAQKIFTNATKNPNASAIRTAVKTVMTFIEQFITKNADKIKTFVDNTAKNGSNKFVRALGVAAGLVLSILSVVGATTILKGDDKPAAAKQEAPVDDGSSAEKVDVEPPTEGK